MSKKFTYYGNLEDSNLILDLFPDTEYFYSLNRGGSNTTNVVEGRNNGNNSQNFTPEELEDGTYDSFATGNSVRIRQLHNQGTVNRPIGQNSFGEMPSLGNPDLYKFNDKMYMSGVERNCFMGTSRTSPVLDEDSTVYLVFRSQSGESTGGVFEERRSGGFFQFRIVIFSKTKSTLFHHSNYRPSGGENFISFPSQQPTETIRLFALRRTGNLVEGFDENGLVGSTTSAKTFGISTLFILFRQTIGNRYFRGHIAELMIREKSDSNTDLNTIINNRKDFYGIN